MWKYENDNTQSVITAKKHIESCHKSRINKLPKTAILFYMHDGVEYTTSLYKTKKLSDCFPRFLCSCPIYEFKDCDICFLDGGRGAPQAVDTIETLNSLGVENVIAVGMFGAFAKDINSGDIVVPNKAFVEEGTSLHYYTNIAYSAPNDNLHKFAVKKINGAKALPVVSTDAVYRQTFYKEDLWRKQGAVGVDMETSALFSVGKYLKLNVVSILIASDIHPLTQNDKPWEWKMSKESRYDFFKKCINFALQIND